MAARPRTLPLAIAPIAVAGGLAALQGRLNAIGLVLALITAGLLQILSNLANDLGDAEKGTDNAARLGPQRAVSSGLISVPAMKRAVLVCALGSIISGSALLALTLPGQSPAVWGAFFTLGALAVTAAVLYTVGKRPYGYAGLGDSAVFLFFGLAGVAGAHTLLSGAFDPRSLLPGAGIGFFATGVLNINNLRDQVNDRAHGKNTLVVRLGDQGARRYHLLLIGLGAISLTLTPLLWGVAHVWWVWLPALLIPLAWRQGVGVVRIENLAQLNPFLGKLSLLTAAWGISLGLALGII